MCELEKFGFVIVVEECCWGGLIEWLMVLSVVSYVILLMSFGEIVVDFECVEDCFLVGYLIVFVVCLVCEVGIFVDGVCKVKKSFVMFFIDIEICFCFVKECV